MDEKKQMNTDKRRRWTRDEGRDLSAHLLRRQAGVRGSLTPNSQLPTPNSVKAHYSNNSEANSILLAPKGAFIHCQRGFWLKTIALIVIAAFLWQGTACAYSYKGESPDLSELFEYESSSDIYNDILRTIVTTAATACFAYGAGAAAGALGNAAGATAGTATQTAINVGCYSAAGAASGAFNATVYNTDVGAGALGGAITGGISGGVASINMGGWDGALYGAGIGATAGAGTGYLLNGEQGAWVYGIQGAIAGGMAGMADYSGGKNLNGKDPADSSSRSYNEYAARGGMTSDGQSYGPVSEQWYAKNVITNPSTSGGFGGPGFTYEQSLTSFGTYAQATTGDGATTGYLQNLQGGHEPVFTMSSSGEPSTFEISNLSTIPTTQQSFWDKTKTGVTNISKNIYKHPLTKEILIGTSSAILTHELQEAITTNIYLNTVDYDKVDPETGQYEWDQDKAEFWATIGTYAALGALNAPDTLDMKTTEQISGWGSTLKTMGKGMLAGTIGGLGSAYAVDVARRNMDEQSFDVLRPAISQAGGVMGLGLGRKVVDGNTYKKFTGVFEEIKGKDLAKKLDSSNLFSTNNQSVGESTAEIGKEDGSYGPPDIKEISNNDIYYVEVNEQTGEFINGGWNYFLPGEIVLDEARSMTMAGDTYYSGYLKQRAGPGRIALNIVSSPFKALGNEWHNLAGTLAQSYAQKAMSYGHRDKTKYAPIVGQFANSTVTAFAYELGNAAGWIYRAPLDELEYSMGRKQELLKIARAKDVEIERIKYMPVDNAMEKLSLNKWGFGAKKAWSSTRHSLLTAAADTAALNLGELMAKKAPEYWGGDRSAYRDDEALSDLTKNQREKYNERRAEQALDRAWTLNTASALIRGIALSMATEGWPKRTQINRDCVEISNFLFDVENLEKAGATRMANDLSISNADLKEYLTEADHIDEWNKIAGQAPEKYRHFRIDDWVSLADANMPFEDFKKKYLGKDGVEGIKLSKDNRFVIIQPEALQANFPVQWEKEAKPAGFGQSVATIGVSSQIAALRNIFRFGYSGLSEEKGKLKHKGFTPFQWNRYVSDLSSISRAFSSKANMDNYWANAYMEGVKNNIGGAVCTNAFLANLFGSVVERAIIHPSPDPKHPEQGGSRIFFWDTSVKEPYKVTGWAVKPWNYNGPLPSVFLTPEALQAEKTKTGLKTLAIDSKVPSF